MNNSKTYRLGLLSVLVVLATVLFAPAAHARFTPPASELIADAQNGRILHGVNIYSLRHPASLTKVMTLYLTFAAIENGRFTLNTYLPVSYRAAAEPRSKLNLEAGSKITVRDAVMGLITQSANDAAVVLAEAIGGSESHFAQIMTAEAKALGMKRTIYRNANGLPNPGQVTTAFDQAILTRAMMAHFPQYYSYFSTDEFTYAGTTYHNHNHLMDYYEGMDGLKTGFINASGFNLIASAKRDKTRLIGIVFGGRTARGRDNRMAQLLDAGFDRMTAEGRGSTTTKYAAAPAVETTADADDVTSKNDYQLAEGVGSTAQGDDEDESDNTRASAAASSATPVAAAATPAKAAAAKNWSVQIGSYNTRKKSLTAIHHAKSKAVQLRSATPRLVQVKANRGTIYRVRLIGLDEANARAACSSLSNAGYSCLPLPPRG